LATSEEQKLKVYEKEVPRRVFGPNIREFEMKEYYHIMRSFLICIHQQ
jgi:hypothetical protein